MLGSGGSEAESSSTIKTGRGNNGEKRVGETEREKGGSVQVTHSLSLNAAISIK